MISFIIDLGISASGPMLGSTPYSALSLNTNEILNVIMINAAQLEILRNRNKLNETQIESLYREVTEKYRR